jgi:enoyl-CoA hydratase/carnithine racemase
MELTGATIVHAPTALNADTICHLHFALETALSDCGSEVVVLSNEDAAFCRGLDLNVSASGDSLRQPLESFATCLEMIRTAAKPVIALVGGEAAGGGVGLAAACDGVLATTEATFTLPELLFGLTPAIVFPYLAQRVSLQKLRWMGLTAQTLTGEEAAAIGLADACCPAGKVPAVLRTWIRRLRRIDRNVIITWKRMTINAPVPGSNAGVEITLERLADAGLRDRLRRFVETGEAPWMDKK